MQFQGNKNLKEFILIEYPAVVKNLDKAVETLGGLQAISKAHFSSTPLELQFRPENPFHSSLVADRRNQGVVFSGQLNLVLRCRRRKPRPGTGDGQGTSREPELTEIERENSEQIEIKCLGMVSTIYSFRNICDFQYLPLSNITATHQGAKVHQDLLPQLVPCDFLSALNWFEEQPPNRIQRPKTREGEANVTDELELFLPPYQFSRYNNPSKFLLRNEVDHRAVRQHNIGHGRSLRLERKALTIVVNARDPFPAEPSDEAIKDVELRCKNLEHHRLLTELFTERPLWSRVAIAFRTHINDAFLKIILAKYAFYITSGPWGRLWCRFGYDPRQDPEARKFQSLMVNFKRNQYIPERQRLRTNTSSSGQATAQFYDYIYRPGILPTIRQMWYSICDVQLPLAQKICRKGCLETLRECDPVLGWLPAGRLNSIRRAIKDDVALTSQRLGDDGTTIGGADAEELEEEYLHDLEEDDDDEPLELLDDEDGGGGGGMPQLHNMSIGGNDEIELDIEDY